MFPSPVCMQCRHFTRELASIIGPLRCRAFPDGIPDSILDSENDHTQPVEGDHGIRFTQGEPDWDGEPGT